MISKEAKYAYQGNIQKKNWKKYAKKTDIAQNRASDHDGVLSHSSGLQKDYNPQTVRLWISHIFTHTWVHNFRYLKHHPLSFVIYIYISSLYNMVAHLQNDLRS